MMQSAIYLAKKALKANEVPVGAIIVDAKSGEVIAEAYNHVEAQKNPLAHAEMLAIAEALAVKGEKYLSDCDIYVTLEPCPLCASALSASRIRRIYFGAYDRKGGSISLGYNFPADERLNHTFSVMGGVKHYECSRLLSSYFKQKRNKTAI